jgi:hypothetical protein
VTDAEIDATYDAPGDNQTDGTVTVTVMDEDGPVSNASVELAGDDAEAEGETDANGTYTAEMNISEELGVEAEKGNFTGEVEYRVENDSLVLLKEEYEYEDREEESDEEEESEEDEQEEDEEDPEESEDEEREDDESDEEDESDDADEEDEEDEEDDDDEGEGRGPPDDVPRGPPDDVPRGPPEDVPRGPK